MVGSSEVGTAPDVHRAAASSCCSELSTGSIGPNADLSDREMLVQV